MPEKRSAEITSLTIREAYWLIFRFHLGTAAFGAIIIAFIQFARSVAIYVQRHTPPKLRETMIFKMFCCCIQAFLLCLEKCMKFLNKHAFIQTAIHGSSFIVASRNAFFIIARNIIRVGALSTVSSLALFVGKMFVAIMSGCCSYIYFTKVLKDGSYLVFFFCLKLPWHFQKLTLSFFILAFFVRHKRLCWPNDIRDDYSVDDGVHGFWNFANVYWYNSGALKLEKRIFSLFFFSFYYNKSLN